MDRLSESDVPLTDEEEAAIQAGIAADPDAFELDDDWFARARPAMEVEPEWIKRWMRARGLLPNEDGSEPELPAMTMFEWIERNHGEEEAIYAGIAADPDSFELDEEWFKRARPAIEVHPEWIKTWKRNKELGIEEKVRVFAMVDIDLDLVKHFMKDGDGWEKRLNDTLRKAVMED